MVPGYPATQRWRGQIALVSLWLAVGGVFAARIAQAARANDAHPLGRTGTAIVVHPDGYLVTAHRLVRIKADSAEVEDACIEVHVADRTYEAKIVAEDPGGLVLLKISAKGLPWIPLAKEEPELGTDVWILAQPSSWTIGKSPTVVRGIVSNLDSDITAETTIRVDANIPPSATGGCVVNRLGALLGILAGTSANTCQTRHSIERLLAREGAVPSAWVEPVTLDSETPITHVSKAVAYVRVTPTRWRVDLQDRELNSVAFVRDGMAIAAFAKDEKVAHLLNWRSGQRIGLPITADAGQGITCLAASQNGRWLAVGTTAGDVAVIDAKRSPEKLASWNVSRDFQTEAVAISDDGQTLGCGHGVSGQENYVVSVWNVALRSRRTSVVIPLEKFHLGALLIRLPTFALSHDGRWLAHEWRVDNANLQTKSELRLVDLRSYSNRDPIPLDLEIRNLHFLGDGRLLCMPQECLVDPESGRAEYFRGDIPMSNVLAVQPRGQEAGQRIAFALEDSHPEGNSQRRRVRGVVDVWDLGGRISLLQLATPTEVIDAQPTSSWRGNPTAVAISPDGRTVVTGHRGSLRVWDLSDAEKDLPARIILTGHEPQKHRPWYSHSVRFSPDGRRVASSSLLEGEPGHGELLVSDLRTGEPMTRSTTRLHASSIEFAPTGNLVAAVPLYDPQNVQVDLLDLDTGRQRIPVTHGQNHASGLAFSPDGMRLITTTWTDAAKPGDGDKFESEHFLQLWDISKDPPSQLLTLAGPHGGARFSPDGQWVVYAAEDGALEFLDPRTSEVVRKLEPKLGKRIAFQFSPNGKTLAIGGATAIELWDVAEGKRLKSLEYAVEPMESWAGWSMLRFAPRGDRLAAVYYPGGVGLRRAVVWDVGGGQVVGELPLDQALTDLQFSNNGQRLDVAQADWTIRSWSLQPERLWINTEAFLARAEEQIEAKEYAQALSDCSAAIKLQPRYAPSYLERAQARRLSGDDKMALDDCTRAIELDPYFTEALLERAELLRKSGQMLQAQADCGIVLATNHFDSRALSLRAELREEQGDFAGALGDYSTILQGDGDDVRARVGRGGCRAALGDLAGAIEDYDAALRPFIIPPVEISRGRGLALAKAHRYSAALVDLTRALELNKSWENELAPVIAETRAEFARMATSVVDTSQPEAAEVVADRCVVRLATVPKATVSIDGKDYGKQRSFAFNKLAAGRTYVSKLRIGFPDGGEAQRLALVRGGHNIDLAARAPSQLVVTYKRATNDKADVWSIDPMRGNRRQLTRDIDVSLLAASRDGAWIAMVADKKKELYLCRHDGGDRRRLGNLTDVSSFEWSPDSKSLIVETWRDGQPNRLHVVPREGGPGPVMALGRSAHWSPSGRHNLYTGVDAAGKPQGIFIAAVDGQPWQVSDGEYAKWSPDGMELLIERIENLSTGQRVTHVLDLRSLAIRSVTEGLGADWSPDGSHFAVMRPTPPETWSQLDYDFDWGLWDIFVVTRNGDDPPRRAFTGMAFYEWIPDGKRLAGWKESTDFFNFELFLLEMKTNQTRLAIPNRWVETAHWSPDATQLAFVEETEYGKRHLLWVLPAGGGSPRMLLGDGEVGAIEWQ